MGTRIHKVLGYGFPRVKTKNDPRFNPEFFDKLWEEDGDLKSKLIEWCEKKNVREGDDFDAKIFHNWLMGTGWYKGDGAPKKLYASDFCHTSGYFSEGKYAPIIFGSYKENKDWYRYDNLIDYYEASGGVNLADKVELITDQCGDVCGIYPNLSYINRNTGKSCKMQFAKWHMTETLQKIGKHIDKDVAFKAESEMCKEFGIKNLNEWRRWIVPAIPSSIRAFCEVMEVFKNPMTVYRLKPMIYTYWC